jgi:hypothetical protein
MTTTDQNAKASKARASVRIAIDANGNPAESMEQATGARFIHLTSALKAKPGWNKETDAPPAGSFADVQFGNAGSQATMFAIFGAYTKLGNIANTLNNGDKGDKDTNPIPQIEEFLAKTEAGEWPSKGGDGVGGVRYQKELLAQAIAEVKGERDPKPYLDKIENLKVDGQKGFPVAADAKGAISYGAFALRNTKVKAIYERLAGIEASPVDAL